MTVVDPYRWLEDTNQERVKKWVRDQDERARKGFLSLSIRSEILKRMNELTEQDAILPPFRKDSTESCLHT